MLIPVLDNFSETNFKGETYYFFDSFIRAAFVEEIFKAIVIVFYCTRKSAFDEPMDGIIYGVAASLGFAAYENIHYIQYFSQKIENSMFKNNSVFDCIFFLKKKYQFYKLDNFYLLYFLTIVVILNFFF